MSTTHAIAFADVKAAMARIQKSIHRTPVMTSSAIDQMIGASLFFKCENFQKTGSFKPRGAVNAVSQIDDVDAPVATHSSGNHGQALAFAAKLLGRTCHVVVPENAPSVKRAAMQGYGAVITGCGATLADRESTLARVVAETGASVVHPYNDPRVMAGQGTVALELHEQAEALDYLFVPVGGGGLMSGCATATHGATRGACTVVGVEPELADDAHASIGSGSIEPARPPTTIADGLRTCLGENTFPIVADANLVDSIELVSEKEIADAMRLIMERLKIVIEPSGAVALAGALRCADRVAGKRVGIIVCGGNVDLTKNAALPFWT